MVQDSIKKKIHVSEDFEDLDEELNAQEYETYEQQVVDQATAAETVPELEAEITILKQLGTPITWYWQCHRTCDNLPNLLMVFSFSQL